MTLAPGARLALYAALGAACLLAALVAAVAWLLALPSAGAWIRASLVALVLAVLAEVVLLFVDREKDVVDFTIEEDLSP